MRTRSFFFFGLAATAAVFLALPGCGGGKDGGDDDDDRASTCMEAVDWYGDACPVYAKGMFGGLSSETFCGEDVGPCFFYCYQKIIDCDAIKDCYEAECDFGEDSGLD